MFIEATRFLFSYGTNGLFADPSTTYRHGVTTISHYYGLFCSEPWIDDRVRAFWNCAICPDHCQSHEQHFDCFFHGGGLRGASFTPGRSICLVCAPRRLNLWITANFSQRLQACTATAGSAGPLLEIHIEAPSQRPPGVWREPRKGIARTT
jgi:hypothetical protein